MSKTKGDHYHNHVHEVNYQIKLKYQLLNDSVKLITHKNLNPSHLHVDRHLRRNKKQGESTSGVQLPDKNLFEAITRKSLHPRRLDRILRYTSTLMREGINKVSKPVRAYNA